MAYARYKLYPCHKIAYRQSGSCRHFKNEGSIQIEKVLEFDYVIVGGGATCSVFAARLAKDSDRSVGLLERGRANDFMFEDK